nr:hypothetical protein [Tanacetum cinerariifolium]
MTSFDYNLNPLYPIKECSSCGALYTTDYCCSVGILRDKIICDLDKTTDLFQRSPQNYPTCGHPVNGHYCQGCAFPRKKFKEDPFAFGIEHGILQDSSEPSNDNSNVVNALREPFVVNQDPGKNSTQSLPQINHHCCYGCGDPLEGIFCHQCTCELCGNGAHYGYNCPSKVPIIPNPEPFNNQTIKDLPPIVQSFDPKQDLAHNSPNVFNPPSELPFISCEFCGNDARYGHYCTPQEEEKKIEEEQATKARYWKIPACYDDDDDDYAFAITLNEPVNSLSMGDEHLDTIPTIESDEFIKSKSLHNHDSSIIISLKIDSLFDEFAGELTLFKSVPSGIDETDCYPEEETHFIKRLLYDNSSPHLPEEFVSANSDAEIESFSPSPIPVKDSDSLMKEIDLSFTSDYPMPPGIEDDDYDSEREILSLKDFLSNDTHSLSEIESFHFDIHSFSRPPAKPPDGNTGILNEKSPDLLSHQGLKAFQPSAECPMMIHGKNTPILDVPLFHFYPLDQFKYGGISIPGNVKTLAKGFCLQVFISSALIGNHNCPTCGHPVNGHYCQGCAFLRKKFKEDLFASGIEHGILQDSFEASNDNSNVVNSLQDHSLSTKTPVKDPYKVLHKSIIIVVTVVEEEKKIIEEQASKARYWKIPACYDDDDADDDYAFAITPNEPVNSLSIEDENLDTILATESDELIKSSVKNLVLIPSESKGEHECDVLAREEFTTFSNILFDFDYDFYSSDDQSFYDEDVPKKIFSNPLFDEEIIPMKIDPHHYNAESDLIESFRNHDSSIIISLKIDPLFDEFVGELTLLKSVPPGIDETDCYPEEETHFIKRLLYDNSSPRPPEEFVYENSDAEIESFSPQPIPIKDSDFLMEEIDLSFTLDYPMLLGIEDDDYDSERGILILKDLLSNETLSLPEIESFHFDIPSFSRPPAKPPDGNT